MFRSDGDVAIRDVMGTVEDQLTALRELLWLYLQAKLWGRPRRFEYVAADAETDKEDRRQLQREMMHAHVAVEQQVREARKRLLATGYPAPDTWLTVRVTGEVSTQHSAATNDKPELAVLVDSGADLQSLDVVCREMGVALLKLEASAEASDRPAGSQSPPPTRTPVEYDVPVTLAEFIRACCVGGEKLPDQRVDSIVSSIQNATRRAATGVQLPAHVGVWRPGQRKYYRPSLLRAAWPALVDTLHYLPPLKPDPSR
jgi:hypothetical protein